MARTKNTAKQNKSDQKRYFRKSNFTNMARDVVKNVTQKNDVHFTSKALEILQKGSEAFLIDFLQNCQTAAICRVERGTASVDIQKSDIQKVQRMMNISIQM